MSDNTRTIAVVTGTRAEYGLLKSSMEAIQYNDQLELQVVATGMHLDSVYGNTVEHICQDGFEIDATPKMLVAGDSGAAMAKSLGVGVLAFVDSFELLAPDIVLVLGDRDEPFAAALAAAHMNIPVAHVHGGDAAKGATIDESIRHALTKFAHLHFPASQESANRIRKLGEEPWRISVVGAPGLDAIIEGQYATPEKVAQKYEIDEDSTTILVVQHPLTRDPEHAGEQMRTTLNAVQSFDAQIVCVHPNSDAGRAKMVSEIESIQNNEDVWVFESLPREDYLAMFELAEVLVGNSSSGIIEAPSFGLPVVDVGPRQTGRQRSTNTISSEHEVEDIQKSVEAALKPEFQEQARNASNPYDYGGAGELIANRLCELSIDNKLLEKELPY